MLSTCRGRIWTTPQSCQARRSPDSFTQFFTVLARVALDVYHDHEQTFLPPPAPQPDLTLRKRHRAQTLCENPARCTAVSGEMRASHPRQHAAPIACSLCRLQEAGYATSRTGLALGEKETCAQASVRNLNVEARLVLWSQRCSTAVRLHTSLNPDSDSQHQTGAANDAHLEKARRDEHTAFVAMPSSSGRLR